MRRVSPLPTTCPSGAWQESTTPRAGRPTSVGPGSADCPRSQGQPGHRAPKDWMGFRARTPGLAVRPLGRCPASPVQDGAEEPTAPGGTTQGWIAHPLPSHCLQRDMTGKRHAPRWPPIVILRPRSAGCPTPSEQPERRAPGFELRWVVEPTDHGSENCPDQGEVLLVIYL